MSKTIVDQKELCYFTNKKWTPLHLASREGYLEVVKYLIEKNADVDAKGFVW